MAVQESAVMLSVISHVTERCSLTSLPGEEISGVLKAEVDM
jgi:hypothetical protein